MLNTKRLQMRKGLLSFVVLLSVSKGEMYSSDLLIDLKKANLIVVEGTLYPLLTRLKNEGLLEHSWRESKYGPPRKYYKITKLGIQVLSDLQKTWKELQKSINNVTIK